MVQNSRIAFCVYSLSTRVRGPEFYFAKQGFADYFYESENFL